RKVQTTVVQMPWGPETVEYEIIGDFAVVEGDIIIGRADDIGYKANIQLGRRWTSSTVRYAIDSSIPEGDVRYQRILNAVAHYEERTPLDFIEIENPCTYPSDNCSTDYVLIRHWDQSFGQSATPGGAGTAGMLGGQQVINLGSGFSQGGIIHELGHAVGLFHEQSRAGRDSFVFYSPDCTADDKEGNFAKKTGDSEFGDYDFESIMHYDSSDFKVPDSERLSPPCNGGWPLVRIAGDCPTNICQDLDNDGWREFINAQNNGLSAGDVNALWGMYGDPLTADESNDRFGRALAAADFDRDGFLDLAVGTPYEDVEDNTISNAGAVQLYKGTGEGFQPWKLFTQSDLGALEEANDYFGWSLAAGDFNDDSFPDLAIGARGEEIASGTTFAGAVYLLKGSSSGPQYWRTITQSTLGAANEQNDELGYAVVAADFNGDNIDDLAMGAPGEAQGSGPSAGHVYLMLGSQTTNGLSYWHGVHQESLQEIPNAPPGSIIPAPAKLGTHQAGDRFGENLAAGDMNSDGEDDLAVAAPCDDEVATCAGGVYVFRGTASGMKGWARLGQGSLGSDEPYDRFGYSLAIGDLDVDYDRDLIVGVPYENIESGDTTLTDAGWVYTFRTEPTQLVPWEGFGQNGLSDNAAFDYFGYSIAISQNDGFNNMSVSASGEAWNAGPTAGAVLRFYTSGQGPTTDETIREASLDLEEASDRFGEVVLEVYDQTETWTFVSATGEDASTGAVYVYRTPLPTMPSIAEPYQVLRQSTEASHDE
ncbi:MAG TPA: M12 family metallopeptidase, partial [Haliangium sp.]|nr:M12 family metallopeptidase [Haliangium sp.]